MELKFRLGRDQVRVRENVLDRAIAWVDPVRAQRRLAARAQRASLASAAGGYTGARSDRRGSSSWAPKGNSADADLLPDLAALRQRSRDLVRNAPLAAGAINTVATNIVGTGLMLKPRPRRQALGWTEEQAAAWGRQVEAEFSLWADGPNCDAARAQDFYGLQDLALRSTLENGDVFSLLPFRRWGRSPYQLAVQLVEADRVSNKDGGADTPTLAGGVRLDDAGAAIAYQIMSQHPGDRMVLKRSWVEVPAFGSQSGRRNVLHLYRKRRVGQTRGAPYFAPVLELFKQMDRYTEAEIFAAVLSAMIAITTKTADRAGLTPLESAVNGTTPTTGTADAAASNWDGSITPGLAVDLGRDEEISAFKSEGRPNPQFDPFLQACLRQAGVALELPFEVLIKHFTASYSAARAALLEAWRFYRTGRGWLASGFCQPVYEAFLEEAVALGRVPAPGFFDLPELRAAYCAADWHGDGPGAIDPEKEVRAAQARVAMNLTTLEREIAEYSGGDLDETLEQRGRERAKERQLGIEPPTTGAQAQAPGEEREPGKEEGDGEDDKDGQRAPLDVYLTVPSQVTHAVEHEIEGLATVVAGLENASGKFGEAAAGIREQIAATVEMTSAVKNALDAQAAARARGAAQIASSSQAIVAAVQEGARQNAAGQLVLAAEVKNVARETARGRRLVVDKDGNPIGNEPA